MKVFINPGHAPNGNPDPGAVNPNTGLRESTVAAAVGELVKKYLEKVGYSCKLLQSDSLWEICRESNNWDADLFVSIHCNAAENTSATGTETFAFNGSSRGYHLAGCIQNQLISSLPVVDRGVKSANYYVLRNTDAVAVLVELAFITNDKDEKMLADANYQNEFARAIARGITDFVSGK